MTILVTGGAGYIGSHMVLALRDAGEDVIVLDNLSTGFAFAVPENVPLVVGDFGDSALVSQLIATHKVTAIIHFDGFFGVGTGACDKFETVGEVYEANFAVLGVNAFFHV